MNNSRAIYDISNAKKNQNSKNILITQLKLDASSSQDISLKLPQIHSNHDQFDSYQHRSRSNRSTIDQNIDNGFDQFISPFKKHPSTKQIYTKPSHRFNSDSKSVEQARVTGFKKINYSIKPKVTRLLHAVEDRDAVQSKKILQKFTNKDEEKEYIIPRSLNIESFKLVRDKDNIPKIKNLMCHFINSHKKYFNKEVVKLPHYQKSAPFFVETMQFADQYLEDQMLVNKAFGYDEENLFRNNLILEKVLLERLIKQEKNIQDRPNLDHLTMITQNAI